MPKIMELPKLGVNMEKATIVEWAVQVGDKVELNQRLLDAETDKAVIEIPATMAGILAQQIAAPGDTIYCGQPLAVFIEPGEPMPAPAAVSQATPQAAATPAAAMPAKTFAAAPTASAEKGSSVRIRISPLARQMAKDMGISIQSLRPARPGDRITKADVLAAQAQKQPLGLSSSLAAARPGQQELIPLTGIKAITAERLSASHRASTPAMVFHKVDMTAFLDWRAQLKERGYSVSLNAMMVAVCAKALREFPTFNASFDEQQIILHKDINIGLAVDTAKGLLVPNIPQADLRGVVAIDLDIKEKIERAKQGRTTMEDISGGTFTITNLGMFGIEGFIPIINPPEAAILAMGGMNKEPVVMSDDSIQARPIMRLTLVWDHRINDGAPAARFLSRIKEIMEWPMAMVC